MATNYQEFLNIINSQVFPYKNNLFLHVCCGPCSTSVLKLLYDYFNIYIIFSNSNIDTIFEFNKRLNELYKVININNYDIKVIYEKYKHNDYLECVKGLENEKEGGLRCEKCFNYRLLESFNIANDYIIANDMVDKTNYLTTTLTVSPYKNERKINDIGKEISKSFENIIYLPSNFKKDDGYLNSIILSKKYGLYRQHYCGCEFSKVNNT